MAENSYSSPVFANRYRYETVPDDWDTGRSGLTFLVYDLEKKRRGVIKRAETKSHEAVNGLRNEIAALLALKGQNVPEVYDSGEAESASKNYFYMVIEYIEGIRIEKDIYSLSVSERMEILKQFFGLLANAHRGGIINGDIDLKHLFWRRDKKQLFVIDWGNAKISVDPQKNNEFSYDLARSAEIIYSLVTRKGSPPATGSIALPNDSLLIPGLAPLPIEFLNLCKWAPRTPNEESQSPHTAQELLNATKEWQTAIRNSKPYTPRHRPNLGLRLLFGLIIVVTTFLGISPNSPLYPLIYPKTSTATVTISNTPPLTLPATTAPIKIQSPTKTIAEFFSLTPTQIQKATTTATPITIPLPQSYIQLTPAFDQNSSPKNCWINETTSPLGVRSSEGFSRRADKYWRFDIGKDQATEHPLQTDFASCFANESVAAFSLNVRIARLELERNSPGKPGETDLGKEFGVFIEDTNGQRREYTIWIDREKTMHLRVRKDTNIIFDDIVLILNKDNLKIIEAFPRIYAEFPIQFFFEMNNHGLDILYLQEGIGAPLGPIGVGDINPNKMIRIDNVILPTLSNIHKIGILGYGGETQVWIWPMVFYKR